MRIFILLLTVFLLLTTSACTPMKTDIAQVTVSSNDDKIKHTPEMLSSSYSYGFREGKFLNSYLDTEVIIYNGEKITFPFYYKNDRETELEIGLIMFIDGVQQPFSVTQNNSTVTNVDMYTFEIEDNGYCEFDVTFDPVIGCTGEELTIFYHSLLFPNFGPTNDSFVSYANYHKSLVMGPLNIKYEKPATVFQSFDITNDYTKFIITDEIINRFSEQIEKNPEFFNEITIFEFSTDEKFENITNRLTGSDNAKVYMQAFGGDNISYRTRLYVNHKPIKINGADYIDHTVEKEKGIQFSFDINVDSANRYSTFYAISTPIDIKGRENIYPDKTSSYLLVNESIPKSSEEKPIPGLIFG